MAGNLKPSTAKSEARYEYIEGKSSMGYFNKDASGLFNETIFMDNTTSLEGPRYNTFGSDRGGYVVLDIHDKCNIYAHISPGTTDNQETINYIYGATGYLKILQYDGTDYTIDVTDKHWVARRFRFTSETALDHGLTVEEFFTEELIDRRWQKIVANLPAGRYKFEVITNNAELGVNGRNDNEWYLELATSKRIHDAVYNAIVNHKGFNNVITYTEEG